MIVWCGQDDAPVLNASVLSAQVFFAAALE